MRYAGFAISAVLFLSMLNARSVHADEVKAPPAKDDDWKAQFQKDLERKVSFEFVDTPFEEAVAFLRELTMKNLVVAPEVGKAGKFQEAINLKVREMSLADALTWICRSAGCKYELKDHAICVDLTPDAAAKAESKTEADTSRPAPVRGPLKEKLKTKVSCDYMKADMDWIMNTLFIMTGVNIVLDPAVAEEAGPVTIHVDQMVLSELLDSICKLKGLAWEPQETSIRIFLPAGGAAGRAAAPRSHGASAPRLHVKFHDGNEVETDLAVLNSQPGLAREILDRAVDLIRDGLLAYELKADHPRKDSIMRLLKEAVPEVKAVYEEASGMLVLTADDTSRLRRAAALMRAFRIPQAGGVEPPAAGAVPPPAQDAKAAEAP